MEPFLVVLLRQPPIFLTSLLVIYVSESWMGLYVSFVQKDEKECAINSKKMCTKQRDIEKGRAGQSTSALGRALLSQ